MAVAIVESTRPVTGGVDTHLDTHVAAALDASGGVLGVESFPATRAGYMSQGPDHVPEPDPPPWFHVTVVDGLLGPFTELHVPGGL
jgi:hypothetical protein